MKFIGKPRRKPRYYTQGTLLFYDKEVEDYLSLHEVNIHLRNQPGIFLPDPTDPDGVKAELIFFQVTQRFRFIGVFRNVMPGNDAMRYRNLMSRQPLMGVDVTGRTNIMDLFERGSTADTVHLGLFPIEFDQGERLQFVPLLNRGEKVGKYIQSKLGDRHENAFCRCVWDTCLGLLDIGTVVRTPAQKILRNREVAWEADNETKAQAMNLLEIIMV